MFVSLCYQRLHFYTDIIWFWCYSVKGSFKNLYFVSNSFAFSTSSLGLLGWDHEMSNEVLENPEELSDTWLCVW